MSGYRLPHFEQNVRCDICCEGRTQTFCDRCGCFCCKGCRALLDKEKICRRCCRQADYQTFIGKIDGYLARVVRVNSDGVPQLRKIRKIRRKIL